MKINFTLLILLTLSSCAVNVRDAESDFSENKLPSENETGLMKEFENETLDQKAILTFEKRGEEKIRELFELLDVVGDQQYDKNLRESAKSRCLSFFADTGAQVRISQEQLGLMDFLNKIHSGSIALKHIIHTEVSQPITLTSAHPNPGKISFSMEGQSGSGRVSTHLTKVKKAFGEETKTVWEIVFTELEIHELH